jgi:hypothetical protein
MAAGPAREEHGHKTRAPLGNSGLHPPPTPTGPRSRGMTSCLLLLCALGLADAVPVARALNRATWPGDSRPRRLEPWQPFATPPTCTYPRHPGPGLPTLAGSAQSATHSPRLHERHQAQGTAMFAVPCALTGRAGRGRLPVPLRPGHGAALQNTSAHRAADSRAAVWKSRLRRSAVVTPAACCSCRAAVRVRDGAWALWSRTGHCRWGTRDTVSRSASPGRRGGQRAGRRGALPLTPS